MIGSDYARAAFIIFGGFSCRQFSIAKYFSSQIFNFLIELDKKSLYVYIINVFGRGEPPRSEHASSKSTVQEVALRGE